MIKLLIGGSPCTFWSIAQKNNRETEAEGMGWELFKNYLIAKEKFKPDFFLYENNKSASQPIKDQISRELGVPLMHINSALVSAQNRERFYAFNWVVDQPKDRAIVLRDILETSSDELCYELVHNSSQSSELGVVRIGDIGSTAQAHRVYSCDGKSVTINAGGGGQGGKTGLYATPICHTIPQEVRVRKYTCDRCYDVNGKMSTLTTGKTDNIIAPSNGKETPIYEVKDGLITIKGKQYPIKLADGYYIIRKLTVTECCRLQTLPDNYCRAVSNSQAYKGLGNGWTAEVIIHILNGALKDVPRDEEIVVLSMYDGIGTGRYCLDKMGFTNVKYFAYEIDKYAKQVALSNYPDIIHCGDAFDLRHPDWTVGY